MQQKKLRCVFLHTTQDIILCLNLGGKYGKIKLQMRVVGGLCLKIFLMVYCILQIKDSEQHLLEYVI